MFNDTVLCDKQFTYTNKKTLQTTDLSFLQRGRLIITKLQEPWKTKKSGHEPVKEAGHRDLLTSKIPWYVLARPCGIPTLQTAIVNNRQSCSQLSQRTGYEGRGMRSSGYGRAALPATWCIPENVIDDNPPAEPVSALHEHCINYWLLEFRVAHVLQLEEPIGQNCWFKCLTHFFRDN
jgi:hypothetical protein